MRRIFSFLIATVVAAFSCSLLLINNTHAETEATWVNKSSIRYDGNVYSGPIDEATATKLNLTAENNAYTYVSDVSAGIGRNSSQTVNVIYFDAGNVADATAAKYKTFNYQAPNSYSNPSAVKTISIDKQSEAPLNGGTTSCDVGDGMGWIVCPITNGLASLMDLLYSLISGFLNVRPITNDQNTALFRAWSYSRSIANVAFVIAFLIIIYSQVTGHGISNYGIKKLLPRLIIAAILVNVSYYICAVAIDISNILGHSVQDVFVNIRNSIVGDEGNTWSVLSWRSLSSFILSGGTMAVAGLVSYSIYGVGGLAFLLLSAIIGGVFALFVALVIMAARQAIVTILVVLSPLAFVAYLLPNTEKLFEKWKSTLTTMLVLFPAFSVIFGGSQLAGSIIIQNADSIFVIILGMMLQVVPLFITPLLIKFSGSLLGKIAGIVNDPNKGPVDKLRKYAQGRAEDKAAERLSRKLKPIDTSTFGGKARRYTPGVRLAQTLDHNRRLREGQRKNYQGMADNNFTGSDDYRRLHESAHIIDTEKRIIEQTLERDLNAKIKVTPQLLRREMELRIVTNESTAAKNTINRIDEELRAGRDTSIGNIFTELANNSERAAREISITGLAIESAKRIQQENLEKALAPTSAPGSTEIPRTLAAIEAAGIDGERGIRRAQAFAKSAVDKRLSDDIAARVILMDSTSDTTTRIKNAVEYLKKAINENEVVDARAAMKMLLTSGAPGKMKLNSVLQEIEGNDVRDVVMSIKSGLLIEGIKSADVTLDRWATNKESLKVGEVAKILETFTGLNPEELAGQNAPILNAAFRAGAITKDVADSVLSNEQASRKLAPAQRRFFTDISNGVEPTKLPE